MKALVTGATGFIGLHLCRHLRDEGWDVEALARPTSQTEPLQRLGIQVTTCDITMSQAMMPSVETADQVFHLAGLTKALRRDQLYAANEAGVRGILDACARKSNPPKVMLISSLAAAGPWHGRPRVESDPPAPVSNYGLSKRAGEIVAESYATRVPITVVRPPIVFGEGDRSTLAMFKAVYWTWTHAIPGLVPQKFSLIHVHDLVRFIQAASRGETLPAGPSGTGIGYYFADSGEHLSYGQLGSWIGQSLGRPITVPLPIPRPLVWVVGGLTEIMGQLRGTPNPMNLDKAREATAGSWWCSAAKAENQFQLRVTMSLLERLRQTAAWYREQRWL